MQALCGYFQNSPYGAYRIPILGDLFRLNGMNYTMLVEEFESGMLRKYAQFASLDMD